MSLCTVLVTSFRGEEFLESLFSHGPGKMSMEFDFRDGYTKRFQLARRKNISQWLVHFVDGAVEGCDGRLFLGRY